MWIRPTYLLLAIALAGCGAETAATAAAAAKAGEDAQQMRAQVQDKLNAAAELEQQRLREADANRP